MEFGFSCLGSNQRSVKVVGEVDIPETACSFPDPIFRIRQRSIYKPISTISRDATSPAPVSSLTSELFDDNDELLKKVEALSQDQLNMRSRFRAEQSAIASTLPGSGPSSQSCAKKRRFEDKQLVAKFAPGIEMKVSLRLSGKICHQTTPPQLFPCEAPPIASTKTPTTQAQMKTWWARSDYGQDELQRSLLFRHESEKTDEITIYVPAAEVDVLDGLDLELFDKMDEAREGFSIRSAAEENAISNMQATFNSRVEKRSGEAAQDIAFSSGLEFVSLKNISAISHPSGDNVEQSRASKKAMLEKYASNRIQSPVGINQFPDFNLFGGDLDANLWSIVDEGVEL